MLASHNLRWSFLKKKKSGIEMFRCSVILSQKLFLILEEITTSPGPWSFPGLLPCSSSPLEYIFTELDSLLQDCLGDWLQLFAVNITPEVQSGGLIPTCSIFFSRCSPPFSSWRYTNPILSKKSYFFQQWQALPFSCLDGGTANRVSSLPILLFYWHRWY